MVLLCISCSNIGLVLLRSPCFALKKWLLHCESRLGLWRYRFRLYKCVRRQEKQEEGLTTVVAQLRLVGSLDMMFAHEVGASVCDESGRGYSLQTAARETQGNHWSSCRVVVLQWRRACS